MKIAVLSDTHGRTAAVDQAVRRLADRDIVHVIHCGDVDDANLVGRLPMGTHFVWGNCDHDRTGIANAVAAIAGVHHGEWGQLEVAGKSIAFVHGDNSRLFFELESSDAFDFLFYGHTHIADERRAGRTRVINPGALHRARVKTFLIVDVATGEMETIVVD